MVFLRKFVVLTLMLSVLCTMSRADTATNQVESDNPSENRVISDYKDSLIAIIHRRMLTGWYPDAPGVATVAFKIHRSGLIISTSLVQSSDNPEIDEVALATVAVGTQLPPFPEGMNLRDLLVTVPLRFLPAPGHQGTSQADLERSNCAAIKDSRLSYKATMRSDNRTFLNADKTTRRLDPLLERFQVDRLDGGRVEFSQRDLKGNLTFKSVRIHGKIVSSIDRNSVLSTFKYETPIDDAMVRKENFTEVYTREVTGQPTLRRRMEATFEGEDSFAIGGCSFRVYRYREDLHADPSPDREPLSTTVTDYAPELRIPVRQETTGPTLTRTRTVIAITPVEIAPRP